MFKLFWRITLCRRRIDKQHEEELKLKKYVYTENKNNENISQNNHINDNNKQTKHFQINTYNNQNQNIISKQKLESQQISKANIENNTDSNIILSLNETNINRSEKKLRKKIATDFSYSLNESYGVATEKIKEESIFDGISKKTKK